MLCLKPRFCRIFVLLWGKQSTITHNVSKTVTSTTFTICIIYLQKKKMEKFNTPQKGCTYIHILKRIFGGRGGVSLRGFEISFDLLFTFVEHLKKIVYCYIVLQNRESNNFLNLRSWSNERQ